MFSTPPTIAEANFDLKGFHTLYSVLSPDSLFYRMINTLMAKMNRRRKGSVFNLTYIY